MAFLGCPRHLGYWLCRALYRYNKRYWFLFIPGQEARERQLRLQKARSEARHNAKAHAMASRTKDNLKVFKPEETEDGDLLPSDVTKSRQADAKLQEKLQDTNYKKKLEEFEEKKRRLFNKNAGEGDGEQSIDSHSRDSSKNTSQSSSHSAKDREKKKDGKHGDPDSQRSSSSKDKHSRGQDSHRKDSKHDDRRRDDKHRSSKDKGEGHKVKHETETGDKDAGKSVKKKKPVVKRNGPPPMSFDQLLAVAQKNKEGDSTTASTESKIPKDKKNIDKGRPMTQEEKDRLARKKLPEYQKWLKEGGTRPDLPPMYRKKRRSGKVQNSNLTASTVNSDSDEDSGSDESQRKPHAPVSQKPEINSASSSETNSGKSLVQSASNHIQKNSEFLDKVKRHQEKLKQGAQNGKSFQQRETTQQRPKPEKSQQSSGVAKSVKGASNSEAVAEKRKLLKLKPGNSEVANTKAQPSNSPNLPPGKSAKTTPVNKSKDVKEQMTKPRKSVHVTSSSGSGDGSKKQKTAAAQDRMMKHSDNENVRAGGKPSKPERRSPERSMSAWDRVYGQIQKNNPRKGGSENTVESIECCLGLKVF